MTKPSVGNMMSDLATGQNIPRKLVTWRRETMSNHRSTDLDMFHGESPVSMHNEAARWQTTPTLANLESRTCPHFALLLFLLIRLFECSLSDACITSTKSVSKYQDDFYPSQEGVDSRSKSLCPLCVILLPPLSSSFSNTPIFSNACITLRSTDPLASTW